MTTTGFGDFDPDDAIDVAPTPRTMIFLTDLADVCRAAGLDVSEVPGWQTRGRSGGVGYARGRPTHVMVHHTASAWSTAQDVAFLATGHVYAPVSNLHLARDGHVTVIAAGPTNTNGAGGPVDGCPADSMNSAAIGIEAANTGVGEVWPAVQRAVYVRLCRALCDAYSIPIARVLAHFEWAPTRKIDPAGPPSPWERPGDPSRRWDMALFRAAVAAAHGGTRVSTKFTTIDPPKVILDTRQTGGRIITSTREITVPFGDEAAAAVVTITMVNANQPSFAAVWADGDQGEASCVNAPAGPGAIANTTVAPLTNGRFRLHVHGDAHIIVALVGLHHD